MTGRGAEDDSNVVHLDRANERLRDGFLHWQCRIRQIAMRKHGGRPTSGMTPLVFAVPGPAPVRSSTPLPGSGAEPVVPTADFPRGAGLAARIVTVLCKRAEHSATMELRQMVRRTHDPAERRETALEFFAEWYYQAPREFSDTLTATFPSDSRTAARLLEGRECRLGFEQFSQRYLLHCTVRRLSGNDPLREAAFWHNLLFNPRLPADCFVLGFEPDWARSRAEPPIP